jgi:hypothetical protein
MRLEELHITRNNYGFDYAGLKAGEVGGKIKFSGTGGSNVEVVLKDYHITAILAVVADSMVSHTRELANELTTEIIEHASRPMLLAEAAE